MGARVRRGFGEPGAGYHQAAGVSDAGLEGDHGGGVDGVQQAQIIQVHDEQPRVGGVTEPFGEGRLR